jgi:hypothetical protein
MDTVSGSTTHHDSVSGTGGEALFSFDHTQVMSRKRRNKKLESLVCWPQVKHMLDNGTPIPDIVHYIQVTRKEYVDIKAESLRSMLNQWLSNAVNRNKLIDHRVPVRHLNLINSNQERIDPVDAMNMLFAVQMDRVLMGFEKEKARKTLDKDNTANLRLSMDMLSSLNSMQATDPRVAIKAGIPTSSEARMDGTLAQMDRIKKMFEDRWGGTAAKVLMDPDSRNRLFNAVNKIRKTSSVTMSDLIQKNSEQAAMSDIQVIEVSNDAIIESDFQDS